MIYGRMSGVCVKGGGRSDFRTKIQINYVQRTTYQVEARLWFSMRERESLFGHCDNAEYTIFYYVYAQTFVCKYICVDAHHPLTTLRRHMVWNGWIFVVEPHTTAHHWSGNLYSIKLELTFLWALAQTSRTLTGLDFSCYCCSCCWRTHFSLECSTRLYWLLYTLRLMPWQSSLFNFNAHTTSQD